MHQGKTRAAHLVATQRRARVLALRQTGATYRLIAQAMARDPAWVGRLPKSYGPRHAHEDVTAALRQLESDLGDSLTAIRQQELDRLDRLLMGVWPRAQQGDDKAVHAVLKIMERRARYIPGLEVTQTVSPLGSPRMRATAAPEPMTQEDAESVARQLAMYGLYHQGREDTPP